MSERALISELVRAVAPPGQAALERRPVSDTELVALLGAARVAPSASNAQTWRFVTVRSAGTRARLAAAVPAALAASVREASALIVACGVTTTFGRVRREQPFVLIDIPIALTHILLEAAELRIPCTWTLELDETVCRRTLGVPEDIRVLAVLALG